MSDEVVGLKLDRECESTADDRTEYYPSLEEYRAMVERWKARAYPITPDS